MTNDRIHDFYQEMLALARQPEADWRVGYGRLRRLFRWVVDHSLEGRNIQFAGLFAKTDYLMKQHGIGQPLSLEVNAMRQRLRRPEEGMLMADIRTVCRFVAEVTGQAIPTDLIALLPSKVSRRQAGLMMGECLRVVVNRTDRQFIYANNELNGEELTIERQWNDESDGWGLPLDHLEGAQLNLIRPRMDNGIVTPEIIIYEPDYLVDISAIAACFESYAASADVYLVNKLRPMTPSEPALLGNFAGQLLDEAVHGSKASYAESIRQFFARNALAMASCPTLGQAFHQEAQRQKANITAALGTLTRDVQGFRTQDLLLEPTYFCETLGLQGRMDATEVIHFPGSEDVFRGAGSEAPPSAPVGATNVSGQKTNVAPTGAEGGASALSTRMVLIEQKSGKGAYPSGPDPDVPRQQEKHYVQLLLYLALFRYGHGLRNEDVYAFLLYSKYAKGLLQLGAAPRLLNQALAIRNQIVMREMDYAHGRIDALLQLSPEMLRQKPVSQRFWQQYISPQIEKITAPLQRATELERQYFLRFFAFVEREQLLAKIGSRCKEDSGFAAKWHLTLEEKRQAGAIIAPLVPVSDDESIRLQMPDADEMDASQTDFRVGDIVLLYPYERGTEPDVRRQAVMRATITAISTAELTLRLRHEQVAQWRQNGGQWAVEHDFFDSSFSSLYRGLHTFLTAPKHRRDLLLAQRMPRVDTTRTLNGDYKDFNPLVLRAKQADELFMVIGPPGTGKTSCALMNILKEELTDPASSILLMAYTNRAVDEICSKLRKDGIDFVRIGGEATIGDDYRDQLLENQVRQLPNVMAVQRFVQDTRIFCGTTASINAHAELLAMKQYSLAIIDEASQILEPHIVGLLSATTADGTDCSIRKFVMIGDHKQLPAVVMQGETEAQVESAQLREIGLTDCRRSLFERMLRSFDDDRHRFMLTRQWRMHPAIADIPNRYFYEGLLKTGENRHQLEPTDNGVYKERVTFVGVMPDAEGSSAAAVSDKVNLAEARVIARLIYNIYERAHEAFDPERTVGVIVPYRNQIAAIRKELEKFEVPLLTAITIDTVERFQGSERDVIVYGMTVRKPYQLDFLTDNCFTERGQLIDRKLNVALTRARQRLYIVGNPALLRRHPLYQRLIDDCQEETIVRQEGRSIQ